MDDMLNEVRNIYAGNEIDWLEFDYSSQDESLDRITDRRVFFEETLPVSGNSKWYRTSYIRFFQFFNTPLNRRGKAFIISHELLHQFLNETGLLLFSTPRFFQPEVIGPDTTFHIDPSDSDVAQFGLNLNLDARHIPGYPPGDDGNNNEYVLAQRIYPVQKYYIEKHLSYFYLMDTDLINHLTPFFQSRYYLRYDRWKKLYNRFWLIYNKVSVHVLSNAISSFDPINFQFSNFFIFD